MTSTLHYVKKTTQPAAVPLWRILAPLTNILINQRLEKQLKPPRVQLRHQLSAHGHVLRSSLHNFWQSVIHGNDVLHNVTGKERQVITYKK